MQQFKLKQRCLEAAEALRGRLGDIRDCSLVLQTGTGLAMSGLLDEERAVFSLNELPHMPAEPSAAGHALMVRYGVCGGRTILVFEGRRHLYDGFGVAPCVLPVCAAVMAGIGEVALVSAAGGVRDDFSPGSVVVLTDFINNTGASPLVGNLDFGCTPFPDMTAAFSQQLNSRFINAAATAGVECRVGVYQANGGPQFETPAEVEIARRNRADVVGMSIVLETIAARALGAEVIGIAVVANKAAAWGGRPIDHASVSERCRANANKIEKSVRGFLSQTLP